MLQDDNLDKISAGAIPSLKFVPQMHLFCQNAQVDLTAHVKDVPFFATLPASFGGDDKMVTSTNEGTDQIYIE